MTLGEIRKRKSFVSGWKHCAVVVLVFLPAACAGPSTPQINPVLQDETLAALPEVPALPPKKPLNEQVIALLDRGPELLIGIGPDQLTAYLGPPALVRHDAPAEVWMYKSRTCYLDLFLYSSEIWQRDLREREHRQEAAADYRVTYYEVRGPDGEAAPGGRSCISALIAARSAA